MTDGERNLRSARLPGGDLVSAVLDRTVMSLADRGGASNMVGARWADVAAAWVGGWTGQERPQPDSEESPFVVSRVARLDDVPAIAAAASRSARQNPDFLIVGDRAGQPVLQAADAKFSVETARSKQVSPDVVTNLLELGPVVTDTLGDCTSEWTVLPGIFLCPDFLLTHLTLAHRQGILRATVKPAEVALVPVDSEGFFAPMEGATAMRLLAAHDQLPVTVATSLLAGLYYMRLARAAIGCWLDATKPLLFYQDRVDVNEAAIVAEIDERRAAAPTAYQLIKHWNEDVDAIRAQRAAVDQAANLPVPNRELRQQIDLLAAKHGVVPPSANQVRRRLGAWYRAALRERIGPVRPPVDDLVPVLNEIAAVGTTLAPRLLPELERIIVSSESHQQGRPRAISGVTSA